MLIGARVETPPNRERVIIISRPGTTGEWRATLPRLLDQRLRWWNTWSGFISGRCRLRQQMRGGRRCR